MSTTTIAPNLRAVEKRKRGWKKSATEMIINFFEATLHEFLYQWDVYPKETYERRAIYDVPVHMCRAPMVRDYIRDMLDGCESWVLSGELEKLVIVILDENGRPLDSLVIEVSWYSDELNAIFTKDNLPLVKMEEEFRSMLVKLTATPISRPPPGTTTPGTFRILAHTLEESSNFETKVDQTEPANSWVLADPTWQEQQKNPSKQLELHPIKSTNSEELPFKMQFYLESRLP